MNYQIDTSDSRLNATETEWPKWYEAKDKNLFWPYAKVKADGVCTFYDECILEKSCVHISQYNINESFVPCDDPMKLAAAPDTGCPSLPVESHDTGRADTELEYENAVMKSMILNWPNQRIAELEAENERLNDDLNRETSLRNIEVKELEAENAGLKEQVKDRNYYQEAYQDSQTKLATIEVELEKTVMYRGGPKCERIRGIESIRILKERIKELCDERDKAEADAKVARDVEKYEIHSFRNNHGPKWATYTIGGKACYGHTFGESVELTRKQAEEA